MRFARLAAFALWLTIALLAVTGFAAFSPETVSTTTTSTTITPPLSAGADWGSTSGRVVALAFTSGLRAAPGLSDLSAEDALISDILGPRPAVTPTETEPEAAISELPASPTTTIRTTTTTASPPTTTTPDSPTTTVVPPTTTTTQPTGGRLTEAETRGIISLFFAPGDVEKALQVSHCESRWDPGRDEPVLRRGRVVPAHPPFLVGSIGLSGVGRGQHLRRPRQRGCFGLAGVRRWWLGPLDGFTILLGIELSRSGQPVGRGSRHLVGYDQTQ